MMEMFFANDIPIIIYTLALLGAVFILIMLYVLLFVEDDFDESDFVIDHEKKMLRCENRELKKVLEHYRFKDKVEYHDVLVEYYNMNGKLVDGIIFKDMKFINGICEFSIIPPYNCYATIYMNENATISRTIFSEFINVEITLH